MQKPGVGRLTTSSQYHLVVSQPAETGLAQFDQFLSSVFCIPATGYSISDTHTTARYTLGWHSMSGNCSSKDKHLVPNSTDSGAVTYL